ncbi:dnaJ homolog subfamily B member 4-like [Impatiens glandulifera]|uniref:dnaJ homolog subfamily B member 4-like n=1 Tax=Impatiens glandulifera TaxID=253017 RepID=UPI001FB0CBF0|nr:dnaJ homolog subfamily B member 4-like [Impatiens glandulifera]
MENIPQSKLSPLKRSSSLDDGSSLSRNKSGNHRNPLTAAVSHKNMEETTNASEFDLPNKEVSSSDKFPMGNSLPRSLSQTSSHRFMGKSMSRKYYSQKGSLTDLHSIDEGGPPVKEKIMSRSMTSRQGTVPIMFSSSNGLLKPLAMEKTLECSLEELCFGCVKKISVSRDAINDIGFLTHEEEQLTIKVQPGWKKGTKLTFPGIGNEKLGTCQADIILVIMEKKHPMYVRRGGDDLLMEFKIPLVDALTGCMITIALLGGEEMKLMFDDEMIETGLEKVIVGQGMPKSKELGRRGNLVIHFVVDFPKELTDEQRHKVCSILENVC